MTEPLSPNPGLDTDDLTPVAGFVAGPSPEQVSNALRAGRCPTDRAFDRFLPHELRVVSGQYWTPLAVAVRAAGWFDELGVRKVVDIGSGAGKFCIVAALAGRCHFTGLEQRPRLVEVARALARLFECDGRVSFVETAFSEVSAVRADAYYLYNPFGENLFDCDDHLDEDVELGADRYARDIAMMEEMLSDADTGTCLLTYNGFGGRVPARYREIRVDRELPSVLRMWKKTS